MGSIVSRGVSFGDNVIIVKPGESIQDAIDAIAGYQAGYYTGAMLDMGSDSVDAMPDDYYGTAITLTVPGLSSCIYEFTNGSTPSIPGAVAVDISGCLAIEEMIQAFSNAVASQQSSALQIAVTDYIPISGFPPCVVLTNPSTYANFQIDVQSDYVSLSEEFSCKYGAPDSRYVVVLLPGTYELTSPIRLPQNVSLIGVDRESCVLSSSFAENLPAIVMNSDTSIENLTVNANQKAGVAVANPYANTANVCVRNCNITCMAWAIYTVDAFGITTYNPIHEISNLQVIGCALNSSNPIYSKRTLVDSKISDNIAEFNGTPTAYFAFIDGYLWNAAAARVVITNNVVRLRTDINYFPYVANLKGYGHVFANNEIYIKNGGYSSSSTLVLFSIFDAQLRSGETVLSKNIIADNFITVEFDNTTNVASSKFAYVNQVPGSSVADIELRNNNVSLNFNKPQIAIDADCQSGNTSKIILGPNAIGGYESGTMELTNITLQPQSTIWARRASGSGLTHAALDTAFGGHETVGSGFIGIYTNTSDSKQYLVWSDGTQWHYAAWGGAL